MAKFNVQYNIIIIILTQPKMGLKANPYYAFTGISTSYPYYLTQPKLEWKVNLTRNLDDSIQRQALSLWI